MNDNMPDDELPQTPNPGSSGSISNAAASFAVQPSVSVVNHDTDPSISPPLSVAANPERASHPKPFLTRPQIFLYVAGDFGLAFMWVCKFATTTAYFRTTLRGGPWMSHLVWSLGPLSGLVTAPVVGVLSDRCTHWLGRRRPFLLVGMLACVIGANVFAHAGHFGPGPFALTLAVAGFAVLDIASNVVMFPARALMGDLVLAEQQHDVQGCAAVLASIAEICAGLYIASWGDASITHISNIFFFASILLALSVCISVLVCVETPLQPTEVTLRPMSEDGAELESIDSLGRESDEGGKLANGFRGQSDFVLEDVDEERSDENVEIFSREMSSVTHASSPKSGSVVARADVELPIVNAAGSGTKVSSSSGVMPGMRSNGADADVGDGQADGFSFSGANRETGEHRARLASPVPSRLRPPAGDPLTAREYVLDVWREVRYALNLAMHNFPRQLVWVGTVYFLAWACWFCTLPAYTPWLGESVLKGSPTAEPGTAEARLYQRGVTLFAVANLLKALAALGFSYWYPVLLRVIGEVGERSVFSIPFIGFALLLWKFAYTSSEVAGVVVIVAGATSFIATQTIPIAIAVTRYPDNLASNLGILNLFCVAAQLFDTLYTGLIAKYFGEAAVMRVGALWGIAAGVASVFLL